MVEEITIFPAGSKPMDPSPRGLETDLREYRRNKRTESLRSFNQTCDERAAYELARKQQLLIDILYEYPYGTLHERVYGEAMRSLLHATGWRSELYLLGSRAFSVLQASTRSPEFKEAMADLAVDVEFDQYSGYPALAHYIMMNGLIRVADERMTPTTHHFITRAANVHASRFEYYDTALLLCTMYDFGFGYQKFYEKATNLFPTSFKGVETVELMRKRLEGELDGSPDPA